MHAIHHTTHTHIHTHMHTHIIELFTTEVKYYDRENWSFRDLTHVHVYYSWDHAIKGDVLNTAEWREGGYLIRGSLYLYLTYNKSILYMYVKLYVCMYAS